MKKIGRIQVPVCHYILSNPVRYPENDRFSKFSPSFYWIIRCGHRHQPEKYFQYKYINIKDVDLCLFRSGRELWPHGIFEKFCLSIVCSSIMQWQKEGIRSVSEWKVFIKHQTFNTEQISWKIWVIIIFFKKSRTCKHSNFRFLKLRTVRSYTKCALLTTFLYEIIKDTFNCE